MKRKLELGWTIAERNKEGILALDIDQKPRTLLKRMLSNLQEKEHLWDCTIFRSSRNGKYNNHHAYFFWNPMPWRRIIRIIREFELADPDFKKFKRRVGFLRMRLTNLPNQNPYILKSSYQKKNAMGDFL